MTVKRGEHRTGQGKLSDCRCANICERRTGGSRARQEDCRADLTEALPIQQQALEETLIG